MIEQPNIEGYGPYYTKYNEQTYILKHPLLQHKLTSIRSVETNTDMFRRIVREIGTVMAVELTRHLPIKNKSVETPLAQMFAPTLDCKKLCLAPIMRAGMGLSEGFSDIIPLARIGHIGVYRDHETLEPKEYFCKMPGNLDQRLIILIDPMLATGGSASAAISMLKNRGAATIIFANMVAAPEGIDRVTKEHPDVTIYTIAVDECLDENAYIVPGLGDAGDRTYGTR